MTFRTGADTLPKCVAVHHLGEELGNPLHRRRDRAAEPSPLNGVGGPRLSRVRGLLVLHPLIQAAEMADRRSAAPSSRQIGWQLNLG